MGFPNAPLGFAGKPVQVLIVAGGAGSGIFVYSPAPGAGNLVASITGTAGSDQFGNAYGAGLNIGDQAAAHFGVNLAGDVVLASSANKNVLEIRPELSAYLVHKSTGPAANSVLASVAAANTTDANGNAILSGLTSYKNPGGGFIAVELDQGLVNFWTATTEAGPWTQTGTIGNSGAASLFLNSNQFIVSEVECRTLNPITPTNIEAWNYVGTGGQPAFGAAWGNLGGTAANLAFKKTVENCVRIKGVIATTGTAPNNNVFTLPAAYRPAGDHRFPCATSASPAAACLIQVNASTGIMQVSGAPGGVATTVGVDVEVSLDL